MTQSAISQQLATSTVTFQIEPLASFWTEADRLFPAHWEEIAVNKGFFKPDMDKETYEAMEKLGRIFLLTARDGKKLVGYLLSFLMPHMHYKSSGVMAMTDIYFVLPQYRRGTGARMFAEWERLMRERGVVQLITSTKVHQDRSHFLELLGFSWTDKTMCKVLR